LQELIIIFCALYTALSEHATIHDILYKSNEIAKLQITEIHLHEIICILFRDVFMKISLRIGVHQIQLCR